MTTLRAFGVGTFVLLATSALATAALADVTVGENVNIVSGTEWPGGDPYLQRQNEPTLAVSSANPQHLLAVANDYRTVDIPNAYTTGPIVGEAWHGVFKSLDGGQTWRSYLLPGYPQDAACAPSATARNPLCGMPAAADPVVRAGTDGMFYVAGLNFLRDKSASRIFLARYVDRNDKENGDAAKGEDPIPYVDTQVVYTAPAGVFVDKPWIAVDVPRAGAATCAVSFPDGAGGTATRSFAGGIIWAGWAEFPSTGPESWGNVKVSSSRDCGRTWTAPVKLNNANSTLSQGVAIAIEPITGRVYVAWRRFASGAQSDAIMATRSSARGKQFAAGRVVARFAPFDQNTGSAAMRTSAFPTMAISSTGTNSWAHVAWQERRAGGASRVVVSSAAIHPPPAGDQDQDETEDRDAETRVAWSAPALVDDPAAEYSGTPTPGGHQLMPSLTFSQGRLVLVYYDSRLDHTRRYYAPNSPFEADGAGRFYAEILAPRGELLTDAGAVFNEWLTDANLWDTRHTLDVRTAVAGPGGAPRFTSAAVSQYPFGLRGDERAACTASATGLDCAPVSIPTFGSPLDLLDAGGTPRFLQQLQANAPNLPMFKNGTAPFLGDYIDVQGLAFVPAAGGGWAHAIAPSAAPVFHAVWTSNQDVRLPPPGADGRPDWTRYTPILLHETSLYDGATPTAACDPEGTANATGSRNQNVYTSRITEGLAVGSPQNVKPLSKTDTRAFVVFARNTTPRTIRVTFAVDSAADGVLYSWVNGSDGVATLRDVEIPPRSHAYRSLFVRLAPAAALTEGSLARVVVKVTESAGCAAAGCLGGSVTLNPPNAAATALVQPDGSVDPLDAGEVYLSAFGAGTVSNPNITSPNITSPNITSPNITSPNITSPNITSPNITSPNITSPNITSNPDVTSVASPNITSPNITSPNITSPNITSPNITSPNITSPNITSGTVSDASYTVTNAGNTTTSYHLKLVTSGTANALPTVRAIVTRTYTNPAAVGCELKEVPQSQLVTTALVDLGVPGGAVVRPGDTVDPGAADPSASNLTFALAPGESNVVTLRGNLLLGEMAALAGQVAPAVVASAFVPTGVTYSGAAGTPGIAVGLGAPTQTTLGYDSATGVVTATVAPASGSGVPTGLATFVVDGSRSAATAALSRGQAVAAIDPPLSAGQRLVAYYGGGAGWAPSTSAPYLAGFRTTTTLSGPTGTVAGGSVTFYATITADGVADLAPLLTAGLSTPLVEFVVDGVSSPATFDSALPGVSARLDTTLSPGAHTVLARFLGWSDLAPSESSAISPTVPWPIQISAYYVSGSRQMIGIRQNGAIVSDAVVTVNGTQLTYVSSNGGSYAGNVNVLAGEFIDVSVRAGGTTATARGIVPQDPVIVIPAEAVPPGPPQTYTAAQPIPVQWTFGDDPTKDFLVWATWNLPGGAWDSTSIYMTRPIDRTWSIPGGQIPADQVYQGNAWVRVQARNQGSLSGNYTSTTSYFFVVGEQASVWIKITP